jgi:hypothetical protein
MSMKIALTALLCMFSAAAEWTVVIPESYLQEEAISVALEDLRKTGQAMGLVFTVTREDTDTHGDLLLVGDAGQLRLPEPGHPEGYAVKTVSEDGRRIMAVAGGSILGHAYGLYWIRDRIRVFRKLPDINTVRKPALERRYTRVQVRNKEDIRNALRHGLNLVYGEDPLRLIPWNADAEAAENEVYREKTRALAAYAHAMHFRFSSFGTDFTYHPSLLEEFGASLDPADPRLWDALRAKYRRLLEAMPELDGVATFTADEQRYWGNYKTFDFLHDGEDCDWDLAKRLRIFIQHLQDVVVGEFGKELYCRTWANTMFEHQSQPEVYRDIFTDAVPTPGLYLIPSFTQNDRWWFQAYNPTINQTPHNTMVVCESMDYHAGGLLFPTFPGAYYQAGLQQMLDAEESNLKGASLDMPASEHWQTRNLTAYCVQRLAWDPHEDPRRIAEDFAAIHFGPDAAKGMGDLILRSAVAYKYGLYIEPTTYGQFNSLPHIRVGQFVAQGAPRVDGGREHINFLRDLYLRCKPWKTETLMYLDHGLETAAAMAGDYVAVQEKIADAKLAKEVGQALENTRLLIQTNNRYVKAFFAYFDYREQRGLQQKEALANAQGELQTARDQFNQTPGFRYQLFGVDQLLRNIQEALDDLESAEARLAAALTPEEIKRKVAEEQDRYAKVLKDYQGEAQKIAHWRGKIDGRDILYLQGKAIRLEHLRWDHPSVERSEVLSALPQEEGVIIPRPIQSRGMHPFILEQPAESNNYTAEIYLNDLPGGGDWWEFELYYLPRSAAELGLRSSFKAR